MAASLLNLLLSASILAHTVLGCCWHHTHPGECAAVIARATVTDHDCESHEHEHVVPPGDCGTHLTGSSTTHDRQHGHRHLCNEPDCMYVVGHSVRLEKASPIATTMFTVQSRNDTSCGALVSAADDHSRSPDTTAELRAALQVWLI